MSIFDSMDVCNARSSLKTMTGSQAQNGKHVWIDILQTAVSFYHCQNILSFAGTIYLNERALLHPWGEALETLDWNDNSGSIYF